MTATTRSSSPHESAHVAAAYVVGIPVQRVSVLDEGERGGYVQLGEHSAEGLLRALDLMVVYLAAESYVRLLVGERGEHFAAYVGRQISEVEVDPDDPYALAEIPASDSDLALDATRAMRTSARNTDWELAVAAADEVTTTADEREALLNLAIRRTAALVATPRFRQLAEAVERLLDEHGPEVPGEVVERRLLVADLDMPEKEEIT